MGRSQVVGGEDTNGHALIAGPRLAAEHDKYGDSSQKADYQSDEGPERPVIEEGDACDDDIDERTWGTSTLPVSEGHEVFGRFLQVAAQVRLECQKMTKYDGVGFDQEPCDRDFRV